MGDWKWTDEQKRAILADDDLLLTANAGTGKTTTVVGRILWLLGLDVGLAPCATPCRLEEIAAITFTEKAAHDLKSKLREKIAESDRADELLWQIDRAALGTIHSFCGQILREYALRLGVDPGFSVLDERQSRLDQDSVIQQVLLERLDAGDESAAELVGAFKLHGYTFAAGSIPLIRNVMRDLRWHTERYTSWARNGELDVAHIRGLCREWTDGDDDACIARCSALVRLATLSEHRWRERMEAENTRDFDALILDTRALLNGEHGAAARSGLQRRFRVLIIDEFQDTDAAQRDIAYAIARNTPRPQLFLVGDPKQSIYRFRGADISVWSSVERDLGESGRLALTQNFRSDPAVIDFVNAVGSKAMEDAGIVLNASGVGGGVVAYSDLEPAREQLGTGAVEWLRPNDDNEYAWLAARIEQLVGERTQIIDPRTEEKRDCQYSDIAVLYRKRTSVPKYQKELRLRDIPFYEQGQAGLTERQEVLDVVNALRVLHNPADDLRMFAFLRSPFVGLRDETIVRMRFDHPRRSMLDQATRFLKQDSWFDAPEHGAIVEIERDALRAGIELIAQGSALANRLPTDELLEWVVAKSGYRAHLHLLSGTRETIANIHAVIRVAEEFRERPLASFLELWDRWDDADQGLPMAPLYSSRDNVVTLSTIHAAKGLEWPIVFLVNVGSPERDQSANQYWSDADLGPLLCPKKDERGARATKIWGRREAEDAAEETRLLYVATTRARDRLIVVGSAKPKSFGSLLAQGESLVTDGVITASPPDGAEHEERVVPLAWIDRVKPGPVPRTVAARPEPQRSWLTSATEMMARDSNPRAWELMYVHGVQPVWTFARTQGAKETTVPQNLRGTIVHGVLERIRDEQELADILEETISDLAGPEMESLLAAGSAYRDALEAEIRQVIRSDEWAWYVTGEHYRELPFLHCAGPRNWRQGAFDLYRPDSPLGTIIDFKTHDITAAGVASAARKYEIQAVVYRAAAAMHGPVRVRLHFTKPNVVIEMPDA